MLSTSPSMTDASLLDTPIWSALTTGHRKLAEGGPLVWRYPPDIAPFAAMSLTSLQAYKALRDLIPPEGRLVLFTPEKLNPPTDLEIALEAPIVQMIATRPTAIPDHAFKIASLGLPDVPDMLQLTELTKPGPFGPRTHLLGDYIGIRIGGDLAAMAGERMRLDGHVEISAVCVHPDHRGKGYAQILILMLMQKLQEQGLVPFLHAFANNAPAIALYEQLGYAIRLRGYATAFQRAGS